MSAAPQSSGEHGSSAQVLNVSSSPSLSEQMHNRCVAPSKNHDNPRGSNLVEVEGDAGGVLRAGDIRLLTLDPGIRLDNDQRILSYNTGVYKIAEAGISFDYRALSYTWGAAQKATSSNRIITIDGRYIQVGRNLWEALSHVTPLDNCADWRLWVDALCINQSHHEERNHQVGQMARIYSQASQVIVWLGIHDWPKAEGCDANVLDIPADVHEQSSGLQSEETWEASMYVQNNRHIAKHQDLIIQWLLGFVHFEYWSRLWILQEVGLAANISFSIQGVTKPWGDSTDFFQLLARFDSYGRTRLPYKIHSWNRDALRQIEQSIPAQLRRLRENRRIDNGAGKPLLELVVQYSTARCKESRDKIFGLRGLSAYCCQNAVVVNYAQDLSDLLYELLLHHYTVHRPSAPEVFNQSVLLQKAWPGNMLRGFLPPNLQDGVGDLRVQTRDKLLLEVEGSLISRVARIKSLAMNLASFASADENSAWIRDDSGYWGVGPSSAQVGDKIICFNEWRSSLIFSTQKNRPVGTLMYQYVDPKRHASPVNSCVCLSLEDIQIYIAAYRRGVVLYMSDAGLRSLHIVAMVDRSLSTATQTLSVRKYFDQDDHHRPVKREANISRSPLVIGPDKRVGAFSTEAPVLPP